jgi:hypothetical protein
MQGREHQKIGNTSKTLGTHLFALGPDSPDHLPTKKRSPLVVARRLVRLYLQPQSQSIKSLASASS